MERGSEEFLVGRARTSDPGLPLSSLRDANLFSRQRAHLLPGILVPLLPDPQLGGKKNVQEREAMQPGAR